MTYNKVKNPYTRVIRMMCDGTETGENILAKTFHLPDFLRRKSRTTKGTKNLTAKGIRQDFMDELEKVVANTRLCPILTPEQKWNNTNITARRIAQTALIPISSAMTSQSHKTPFLIRSAPYHTAST